MCEPGHLVRDAQIGWGPVDPFARSLLSEPDEERAQAAGPVPGPDVHEREQLVVWVDVAPELEVARDFSRPVDEERVGREIVAGS